MDDKKARVARIIDGMPDDIARTISEAVRIHSVNPNCPGIVRGDVIGGETKTSQYLGQIAEGLGAKVEYVANDPERSNLAATFKGTGGGRSLMLCGHVDTVPGGDPKKWTGGDPWSGDIRDGRVYGRGAVDMKGGLVSQLKAIEALIKAGIKLKGDVVFAGVVGEETMDHNNGVSAVVRAGFRTDAAIVSEASAPPYALAVVPCTSGLHWMRLEVEGRPTHSSVRDELVRAGGRGEEVGVDAIAKGVYLYNALARLEQDWGLSKKHPLHRVGHFVIQCGIFRGQPHGTTTPHIVPDECVLDYSIWFPPDEDVDSNRREIEEYIANASKLDTWLAKHPPVVTWPDYWPAANTPVDHPICQAVGKAHEEATGQAPIFHGFCAAADTTFLNEDGITSIIYGPGDILLAHALDEYVPMDEVLAAAKTYAFTMMDWCGVAGE
jgi:acetylornithine deacetylase/succinyl-diaminopimelate desuccinylase family protein